MDLRPNLLVVTDAEKIEILKLHGKTWDEFQEIVDDFKQWIEHCRFAKLSIVRTENLTYFLLNSKLNVEKAKKNVESYCRARASYPDFYRKLIPGTEYVETAFKFGKLILIPKLLPSLEILCIYKIDDIPGNAPDAILYYVSSVMVAEMSVNVAFCASYVIIVDLSGFSMKCLFKYTPQLNFKLMKILNAFDMRVSHIHIVNAPPFINKVLNLAKYVLTMKLFSRIKIHEASTSLQEHIPKDCLPSDYGGDLRSYEEIYEECIKKIHLYKDYFEKAATEEYPSEDEFVSSEIVEGAPSGTFKTLVVD